MNYPLKFNPNGDRVIEVVGEAFFIVAKDTSRPFKVISQGQTIEVLGTEFNICSYPDEEVVYTTLIEGKVKVVNDKNKAEFELIPGQQLNYSKEDGDAFSMQVNVEEYIAWVDDRYIFKEKRLEDIMRTLSRWYNVNFIFEEEKFKDLKFNGVFDRRKNFEEILEVLEKTNEMKFKSDYEGIIIY